MPNSTPVIDPTLTDVLIPSAAILVSAAIAFAIIGIQLAAAKRERRSEAIGRVAGAISHTIAVGSRRRLGENVDLEPAMTSFDAAIIQLNLSVPRRDRIAVAVVRDRMYTEYVSPTPNMEVVGWQVRHELEAWALGQIPNREFRAFAAWSGSAPGKQRHLHQAWADLRTRLAEDPYITRRELVRVDRRRGRQGSGISAKIQNWWEQTFYRIYRR